MLHALGTENWEDALLSRMSEDMRAALQELRPDLKKTVLISTLVFPQCWAAGNCLIEKGLPGIHALARAMSSKQLSLPLSVHPSKPLEPELPRISVAVISGCSGSGVPLWCLRTAIDILTRRLPADRQKCRLHIHSCWAFEINTDAKTTADLIHRQLPWQVHDAGDIAGWPALAAKLADDASIAGFICLGGTECTDTSMANQSQIPQGRNPLHGSRSRTWFSWHKGVKLLADRRGPNCVLHMAELPLCRAKNAETQLDEMAGPGVITNAAWWGGAERNRCWRTSPKLPRQTRRAIFDADDVRRPCNYDGSTWCPDAAVIKAGGKVPPVLRSYWPRLLERHNMQTRQTMTAFELYTIAGLRIKRSNNKDLAFAGVPFFLKFLGLEETPLIEMPTVFQCARPWKALDSDSTAVEPKCGDHILCQNCNRAVQVLGRAWHFKQATEILVQLLELVFFSTSEQDPPSFWTFTAAAHDCGPSCPLAPN